MCKNLDRRLCMNQNTTKSMPNRRLRSNGPCKCWSMTMHIVPSNPNIRYCIHRYSRHYSRHRCHHCSRHYSRCYHPTKMCHA